MDATVKTQDSGARIFHPSRKPYRFTVLMVVASFTVGSYFAYDSLGAIAPQIIEALKLDRSAISSTYSMYSVAAIFTVLIGGILTDRLGTRIASFLFTGLVALGSGIVWMGARAGSMWSIYFGRLIFGAGAESLTVAQSAILARWFKGKELALAFGISLTISRLGTLFSFNTESVIAKFFGGYIYALLAALLFCIFSFIMNALYIPLDRHGERELDLPAPEPSDRFVLGDIRKFGASYWWVTLLCVTFYSAVFPFTSLSTDFFHDVWKIPMTPEAEGGFFAQVFASYAHMLSTAGGITSIPVFASMCLAPFAGHLVDRVGRRGSIMLLGSLLIIPAHLLLGFSHMSPIFPMVLLGAAFVLVPAAMWPSIPLVVEKERVGTAFGLTTMVQNFGLWLFNMLNGLLRDRTKRYVASQTMFAGLGVVGLVSALLLRSSDARAGSLLERTERERAAR
jgi:MFS family permease